MNDKIKILRPKEVIKKLSISKSTFYDWQNKKSKRYRNDFPKPIVIGENSVGYLESEINDFILNMVNRRADKEILCQN